MASRFQNHPPIKRSVSIAGHATSVTLEKPFWDGLKTMAMEADLSLAALIAQIDRQRAGASLSSALRLAVLAHYQSKAAARAGLAEET